MSTMTQTREDVTDLTLQVALLGRLWALEDDPQANGWLELPAADRLVFWPLENEYIIETRFFGGDSYFVRLDTAGLVLMDQVAMMLE